MATDTVNRLIAASGNYPSPVDSLFKGYDDATASQMNRLAMQNTNQAMVQREQQMRQARREAQIKEQNRRIKIAASYMLPVARAKKENMVQAYQAQTAAMKRDWGYDSPEWDEKASPKQIDTLLNMAGMTRYESEKFGDNSLVQTDALTGDKKKIITETDYSGRGARGAEFERNSAALEAMGVPLDATPEEIDSMENLTPMQRSKAKVYAQRVQTVAGTDWKYNQQMTHGRLTSKDAYDARADIYKNYSEGIKSYTEMGRGIDSAIAALQSGETGLADRLLDSVMTNVQDNNIRAMGMYSEFEKSFGHLHQRIYSGIHKFLTGQKTERERQEIMQTLEYLKQGYIGPSIQKNKEYHRNRARMENLNAWQVIPPDGSQQDMMAILSDKTLTRDQIKELLDIYYPGSYEE